MSSGSFKIVTSKVYFQVIYIDRHDLTLNHLEGLICRKTYLAVSSPVKIRTKRRGFVGIQGKVSVCIE